MSFLGEQGHKPQEPKAQRAKGLLASEPVIKPPEFFSPAALEAKRKHSIRLLIILVGALTGLAAVSLFAIWLAQPAWQLVALTAIFGACAVYCGLALWRFLSRGSLQATLIGVSVFFGLSMLGTAALLDNLGIPAAVVYLIFALIVSSTAVDDAQANLYIGIGILFASGAALLTSFSPFEQLTLALIGYLTPLILIALTIICVVMLARQLVQATLRTRLVTAFLAIVIIPLVILSVVQSQFMFQVLSREVSQGLVLAANQATAGVDKFLSDTQKSVQEAALLDIFQRYLSLPENQRSGSPEQQEMRLTLRVLDTNESNSTIYLSSYALLDSRGVNLYDSLKDRVASRLPANVLQSMGVDMQSLLPGAGDNEGGEDYFKIPASTGMAFISPVQVVSSTRGFFFISAPVKNQKGQVLGVLRARYDGLLLQDLLKQYNGLLTTRSYAIMVDENDIRLADAFTPNFIYKSIVPLPADQVKTLKAKHRLADLPDSMLSTSYTEFDQILKNSLAKPVFTTTHSLVYNDNKHSEIGAIAQLRTMPWRVVYLRADYSDAEVRRSQLQITTLVTVIIAGLVAMVAVGAAQLLSRPIFRLTQTAQQITGGDLEAQAPVTSADEFGMLGAAFNLMTTQMRALINQLEERVRARTREIEKQNEALADRARQLQTVADVARQIVSAQELEKLLTSVTQLISQRFGFYHVGIFLLDENKQYAVLRAANSEGGRRMLTRRHMLPVGKVGIVGYATGTGQARTVTDVGEDAVFFNNPDLPATRSEMALPLKVGEQVIGALDIQSEASNAFHAEDIELFNTLADQVAIAIYNNQLYSDTSRALEEAQTLHRQYLRGEWAQDTARRKTLGYLYNQFGLAAQKIENPLWKKVFNTGEPVYAVLPAQVLPGQPGSQASTTGRNGARQPAEQEKAIMAVPISLRGETIGVIQVQDQSESRTWSEDEISVVNSIASQVAVALENARLFENTVRRAEREKKVLQITEKIRSTNDPNEMMRIAIRELQQALGASRAQIYLRQPEPQNGQGEVSPDEPQTNQDR